MEKKTIFYLLLVAILIPLSGYSFSSGNTTKKGEEYLDSQFGTYGSVMGRSSKKAVIFDSAKDFNSEKSRVMKQYQLFIMSLNGEYKQKAEKTYKQLQELKYKDHQILMIKISSEKQALVDDTKYSFSMRDPNNEELLMEPIYYFDMTEKESYLNKIFRLNKVYSFSYVWIIPLKKPVNSQSELQLIETMPNGEKVHYKIE